MTTRKIFNFPSTIQEDETIAKFGYSSDSLGRSSSKFIVATCRFCGISMDVRKGFYNKSGSACHKDCKHKEMSVSGSPFSNPLTIKKAKETNLKRWGNECPQKNEEVKNRMRETKVNAEFQTSFKQTMLSRHGVENPVHIEGHSEKVRETSLVKYGVDHFSLSKAVKDKKEATNVERYGHIYPTQNDEVKAKIKLAWKDIISSGSDKYKMASFVSSSAELWDEIKSGKSLQDISDMFGVDRVALNKALLSKTFKNRYQKLYTYPKHQKQKEIYDYLISIGVDDLNMNNLSAIGLELDMYSLSRKIAVEFNGSYWHSEAIVDKKLARSKHIKKTRMCNEVGIRLINIFEKQWTDRENQYKAFLRSAFGFNSIKIDARKCDISLDHQEAFIDQYHIQGKPHGAIFWVSLIFNNQTVGAMSLSRHHRQGNNGCDIVLSRMVFASGVTVRGGASKMMKQAKEWAKSSGFKNIITWSDGMITNGDVYSKMGFTEERSYGPDYFYWDVKTNSYKSKQSQKKSATGCPKEMTERDWCWENGLYRIWDCGKKKWILRL